MLVSLIVALTPQGVIGKDNTLPWHLPSDLKHFKMLTWGKPIIMGRKTFESIGKPLPGRQNIVITHQQNFSVSGCDIVHSLDEALKQAGKAQQVFIIGGSAVFAEALPFADFLYLTLIHADIAGNIYFPAWEQDNWEQVSRENFPADDQNPYPFSFVLLKRRHAPNKKD